jgi:hypothetical protein
MPRRASIQEVSGGSGAACRVEHLYRKYQVGRRVRRDFTKKSKLSAICKTNGTFCKNTCRTWNFWQIFAKMFVKIWVWLFSFVKMLMFFAKTDILDNFRKQFLRKQHFLFEILDNFRKHEHVWQLSRNQIFIILAKISKFSHIREIEKGIFVWTLLDNRNARKFRYLVTYNITRSHNFCAVHIPRILQKFKLYIPIQEKIRHNLLFFLLIAEPFRSPVGEYRASPGRRNS